MSHLLPTLPAGWAEATVGDLGEFINGLAFKPADWGTKGRPIIRIQNLTNPDAKFNFTTEDFDPRFVVRPGDILVSWSATLDAFVWRGPEAILNQHIFRVVPTRELPEHRFVYWGLKNAIAEMWKSPHTHGTTMRHINRRPFMAHHFALPPLQEQGRLADSLDSIFTRLDDAEATLERVRRNLERHRASVLQAAVEGRLVPTEAQLAATEGRRYESSSSSLERHQRLSQATRDRSLRPEPLWEVPEGWCWASLDQLKAEGKHTLKAGPFGSALKKSDYTPFGFKIYGQEQVIRGDPQFGDYYIGEAKFRELASCAVAPGDLLISLVGTIGQTLVLREGCAPGIINPRLLKVTLNRELVQPEFIQLFLASPRVRHLLRTSAHGGTMDVLNLGILRGLPFPLPPRQEQARIISTVSDVLSMGEVVEGAVALSVSRLRGLRGAILQKAFEGHLVDQDPTDEPAFVLLDRIRAARAKTALSPSQPRHRSHPHKAVKR